VYTILISLAVGAVAGAIWTALGLWKTWAMGIVLFIVVSLVAFIVLSRVLGKRLQPLFEAVQKQIQAGANQAAVKTLEDLLPWARWQVMLKGQICGQIGLLAYAMGDEDKAFDYLQKSGMRVVDAQLALAAMHAKRGDSTKAYSVLDTTIQANKKQILPYHVYAWLLLRDGERDKAIEQLLRCQKIEKSNETTQDNLSRLQNGKKLNMKRFGNVWYMLQLEKPPASLGAVQGTPRKGFRQRPSKKGRR